MPEIDVLVILHNSKKFIPGLLSGLRRITVPVTIYFLDNASTDETIAEILAALREFPIRSYVLRSRTNNGFARGMNLLSGQSKSEFIFMLNPDTEIEQGCLERLLDQARSDPAIGICEARQQPREHHKIYDSQTGETTWCTGAAVLIRRRAFEEIGGFDERIFFMYCEDVDLSWKLWLRGRKCIYVPDAVVRHYTQDIIPDKRRTLENYYSFRNSLFLFYRFGSWREKHILYTFVLNRLVFGNYTMRSRLLYILALIDHVRFVPYLFRTRSLWCARQHPWVRLEETSLAD